ncbi:hypothetical protein L218DRAFT_886042, partial [Marasmius fiardii PR-910]
KAIEGCSIPVDVILRSSEGTLFGAHTKNLESFTEGFPITGTIAPGDSPEIVSLTESDETLDLFLAFTHNHPAPDLTGLDMDSLIDLAKTADKYGNYFALSACKQPMRCVFGYLYFG